MKFKRSGHKAALLRDGRVLVAGGGTSNSFPVTTEVYDPGSANWSLVGNMIEPRGYHTATLLPNGEVLIAGGVNKTGALASTELFNPVTNSWSATGSLANGRYNHTATLLPNGKVLAAGGLTGSSILSSAELYDPTTGTWAATGDLTVTRGEHTATLLANGQVLVAGGLADTELSSSELYDPATGTWTQTDSMEIARYSPTATLLPNGQVLIAAGGAVCCTGPTDTAELYDVGLGFRGGWQPVIGRVQMTASYRLQLTGLRFQGISPGSGGNFQDSSTNYPVVQLRSIDNSQMTYLFVDPVRGWSDTDFFSLPARGFVSGPALVTVFTNGIPSEAKYLVVLQ